MGCETLRKLERRAFWRRRAAATVGERCLLRATVWLEGRYSVAARREFSEAIALHYLLLSQLREVHAQPGLAERYRRTAEAWAAHAELGLCSEVFAQLPRRLA